LVAWIRLDLDTMWVQLEQDSVVKNISITNIPFLSRNQWRKLKIQNEWVVFTLGVWDRVRKKLKLPLSLSRAARIDGIADFKPNKMDRGFGEWADKGLLVINQLFTGTTIKTFSQLQREYNIANSDLFRFFQIRHYLQKHKEIDKVKESPTDFEKYWIEVVENQKDLQKIVSALYQRIRMEQEETTLDVKNKWELELNRVIEDTEWEKAWDSWHKCLNSPNWREFSWKIRMRFFRTPIVIASYDNNASNLCWRKCGQIGDFSHIFWECPKVKGYWEGVKREIGIILNLTVDWNIHKVILEEVDLPTEVTRYMLRVLVLIAHKVITVNWLKPHPPTLEQWVQRLKTVNLMEDITATLRLRKDIYNKRWTPVNLYLEQKT
uniref:Reverse transcriptase zinc-binding domain-containing protein n=1 Tax=Poecilia formosa TaxID=48698 RepID=A0A087YQ60_POEFO